MKGSPAARSWQADRASVNQVVLGTPPTANFTALAAPEITAETYDRKSVPEIRVGIAADGRLAYLQSDDRPVMYLDDLVQR